MSLTTKEVEHVAKLARLDFDEEKKEAFKGQLNDILNYIEMLEEVDVTDTEPTYHVLPIKNVFRKDEVKSSMDRAAVLENAPDALSGCFRVPKVVE
jgi:aspartyl-tRNA(Asn)/glutamyl-tRNA(Gln) amidotransferase subunit C